MVRGKIDVVRPRSGWLRGIIAGMLAMQLALGAWTGEAFAEDTLVNPQPTGAAEPSRGQLDEALAMLQASLGKIEPVSDWLALGMARSGKPVAGKYLPQAGKSVDGDNLRLVTDYARVALAVNANGGDARKVGAAGIDLLGKIANFDKMTAQGPNATAFALMALDAGNYTPPGTKDRWTRDSLIQWLIDNRGTEGGWSLAAGKSDVDVTGIVLTALSPYYQNNASVKASVDKALDWLSGAQRDNGGFGSPESSESNVQVLIALTSLGMDPGKDPRFVKNGKSALSRLMEFRLSDGSFAHVPGGKADGMASLHALLGLTAVERWQDGLPGLYAGLPTDSSVDVLVYGASGKLAQEKVSGRTGLESLIETAQKKNISYSVERHPQFGPFLTSVAGSKNGSFGGFDGWQYAVKRGGQWLAITEGLGVFVPKAGDRLVVYYGENSALVHSVKLQPAAPREGQPFTAVVEKETYDWESGKAVVGPAEAANVSIAGKTYVTDKDGKATLDGVRTGRYTLKVDGYRSGAAPVYVAEELSVEVDAYVKDVTVRVEGDQGVLAEGAAQGGTALEALESLLKTKNVAYEVKELSFGKYVSSIADTKAGKFAGYDGWLFAVKSGDSWISPTEGIGTFLLEDGQQVVVYYGDGTKLPEPVVVTPPAPKPGDTVTITVTYRDMNWETGKPGAPTPLAGVKVVAAGVSSTTDAEGKAKLAGIPEGVHQLTVTGYAEGKAPSIVRTVSKLTVAADYGDQNAISDWAVDWVRSARATGVLMGPDDSASAFKPKAAITRAEFVTSMVRALGLVPENGTSFKDVSAKAWYAKEIQAAAKAGLIAGVSPGKFAPDAKLTREQSAQLLTRALKITATQTAELSDAAKVSRSAVPAVQAVLEHGWMTAGNGKFLPKQTLTREQAAVIAVRILFRPGVGKMGE